MELSSNWTSEDNDIIRLVHLYNDNLPEALSELLDDDWCFVLSKPKHIKETCYIKLKSLPTSFQKDSSCSSNPIDQFKRFRDSHVSECPKIVSITVISESKLIEVFVGNHEEYLGSFSSTVVEELSDSIMCRTVIDLGKPQSDIKLVFKNIFEDSSMLVYGVSALKAAKGSTEDSSRPALVSRFSSTHLDSVLSDHGVTTLSKEAAAFKKVLQQYNDRSMAGGAVGAPPPSMPLAGLLPLLGAGGSAGSGMFNNLAALVQKQYPSFVPNASKTQATNIEEDNKESLPSGPAVEIVNNSICNSTVGCVLTSETRTFDSQQKNSVFPFGTLDSLAPNTVNPATASSRKSVISEKRLCEDITSMDLSPGDESQHSSSTLSSCSSVCSETLPPDSIVLPGADEALQDSPLADGLKQGYGNFLPLGTNERPSGQLLGINQVEENRSYNGHINEHLVEIFEGIIDKKLAAFEKRIETMVSQKLSETTSKIFTKLNSIEGSIAAVQTRERLS